MYQITLTLNVISPVIFSEKSGDAILTATRNHFTGTSIKGLFALEYIKAKNLGQNAHLDPIFSKYFLKNTLRFLPAYIARQTTNKSYQAANILPLCLQKNKDGSQLLDLTKANPVAGYKNFKGYAFIDSTGNVQPASIHTQSQLHINRTSNTERIIGSSSDGNVYTYEAISPNQTFQSVILGDKDDLEYFLKQILPSLGFIDGKRQLCIGRARNTQYGLCELFVGQLNTVPSLQLKTAPNTIWLYFTTPYIPAIPAASAKQQLQELIDRLAIPQLKIDKIFAATNSLEGFVSIWGLKKPKRAILEAGTVFSLNKPSNWTVEELDQLQKILYLGIGEDTIDGYGQLRFWDNKDYNLKNIQTATSTTYTLSPHSKKIIEEIIAHKVLEVVRLKAANSASALGAFRNSKSLVSRLENYLLQCKGNKLTFTNLIISEIREHSPAAKTLLNIKLLPDNLDLFKIFRGEQDFNVFIYNSDLAPQLLALAKEINYDFNNEQLQGRIFSEYWLWFLRHSRKTTKGE